MSPGKPVNLSSHRVASPLRPAGSGTNGKKQKRPHSGRRISLWIGSSQNWLVLLAVFLLTIILVAPQQRSKTYLLNQKIDHDIHAKMSFEYEEMQYAKGDVLVKKHQEMTQSDLDLVEQMDLAADKGYLRKILAVSLYIALLFALVFYYMRLFRPDIKFDARNILLVSVPVLLALLLGRITHGVVDLNRFPEGPGYAFPSALIGMLAVILFDARTAVLLVTTGSLAFSLHTGIDFKVFLVSLFGGYVAVTTLTTVQERKEMLKAGLFVGLANTVIILLIHYIDDPSHLRSDLIPWGIGSALASAIITMPALVMFEKSFGIITDIGLLELTGLDHPLLMELEEKAPGSFQHSLNVCKLAEAAAKTIGANYLLVRAGAYYHDIGKILKPKYSIENTITLEEKGLHSKLSPNMSAMIIKNHVKGGMDLARKYNLPDRVADFVPQHHGTTLIAYFYNEALKRFENSQTTDPVRESDFRYPGPKPQSQETAIVLLADAVEAATTSRFTSLSVNEDELQMSVQRIITDKFADGQFDESDLTLRHLHQIRESFVRTLLGRFHHRIAYPTRPTRPTNANAGPTRDRMDRK